MDWILFLLKYVGPFNLSIASSAISIFCYSKSIPNSHFKFYKPFIQCVSTEAGDYGRKTVFVENRCCWLVFVCNLRFRRPKHIYLPIKRLPARVWTLLHIFVYIRRHPMIPEAESYNRGIAKRINFSSNITHFKNGILLENSCVPSTRIFLYPCVI